MYEVKKMLLYHRGIIIVLVLFFMQCIYTIVGNNQSRLDGDYLYYLNQIKGAYTNEKAEFLENEAILIAQGKEKRQTILDNYYDGKITEKEFQAELEEVEAVLKHESGFEKIYEQYLYVYQNSDNRYFLQTDGWEALFSQRSIPFFMMLAVLLVATPIFCSEYYAQMDVLITTNGNGRKIIYWKIGAGIFVACGFCIAVSIFQYIYFATRYGLVDGSYPMQSIQFFASSTKTLTLNEAFGLIILFRLLGSVYFALEIMLISIFTKKYAATVFMSSASIIIPYLGFTESQTFLLPFPLPFLLGYNFLLGSKEEVDGFTGEMITIFKEISKGQILFLLIVSIGICVVCVIVLLSKNTNVWCKKLNKRKFLVSVILLNVMFMLVGCSPKLSDKAVIYNSSMSDKYEDELSVIYFETKEGMPIYEDKSSGQVINLIRDPLLVLKEDTKIMPELFRYDSKVYYIRTDSENYQKRVGYNRSAVVKISVVEIDLIKYEEQIIFEKLASTGRNILGIEYDTGYEWQFLQEQYGFFLNESCIFFITNEGVYKVNRLNGNLSLLNIETVNNVAFDGRNIYYLDKDFKLHKFDTETENDIRILEVAVYNFCMINQYIYFINRQDDYKIYKCDTTGGNIIKIVDEPALHIEGVGESISYIHKNDGEEYFIGSE